MWLCCDFVAVNDVYDYDNYDNSNSDNVDDDDDELFIYTGVEVLCPLHRSNQILPRCD